MNKKQIAKMQVLRELSKKKGGEAHKDIGDILGKKKLSKITVMAPDEEGLEEGLTKAQQILKAKLGDKLGLNEDEHDEESCEHCKGKGCDECSEEEEEEDDE